jgi:hypothetical protein
MNKVKKLIQDLGKKFNSLSKKFNNLNEVFSKEIRELERKQIISSK